MVHNDKKKQIILAVEKLAANHSLYEITLDEVAGEAKIGKGTIYHYFDDKEDLFFEVTISGFDELCELLTERAVNNNAPFSVKFHNICSETIRFFAGRPQLLKIMQSQASRTYWSKDKFQEIWMSRRKKLVDTVSNILSEGMAEGTIRSDIPADFLAVSLLDMLRSCVKDLDASSDLIEKTELLVGLFLNGACNAHKNNGSPINYSQTAQRVK
jgi:AcrR family transcriptional regulator